MKRSLLLAACASTAFCLSGCKFWGQGGEKDGGATRRDNANDPVLVKIDGKPVLHKEEFLEFADQAMKANPYLSSFGITSYESAPEPIRQQLLEAMVQQKLISIWGQAQGIEKTAEYKESYAKLVDQLKQALVAQSFDKQIFDVVTVSEEEVFAKYEENRHQMIKDPGSVKAVGVSFKSEEKANVFFDLVANKEEDSLVNLAKESDATVVEFGTVPLDSRQPVDGVPSAVRKALVGLAEKQYYTQAKDGDIYWVIQAVDRVKPTYMAFEEVQEQLSSMVKQEKFRAVREERLKEIRGHHTVDVDNTVLGAGKDPFAALQQMLAAQGQMDPELLQQLSEEVQEEEDREAEGRVLAASV